MLGGRGVLYASEGVGEVVGREGRVKGERDYRSGRGVVWPACVVSFLSLFNLIFCLSTFLFAFISL